MFFIREVCWRFTNRTPTVLSRVPSNAAIGGSVHSLSLSRFNSVFKKVAERTDEDGGCLQRDVERQKGQDEGRKQKNNVYKQQVLHC